VVFLFVAKAKQEWYFVVFVWLKLSSDECGFLPIIFIANTYDKADGYL